MGTAERMSLISLISEMSRNGLSDARMARLGAMVIANPEDFGLDGVRLSQSYDASHESHVAASSKPWEAEGISRATWYRRRHNINRGTSNEDSKGTGNNP